jgi:hypothetical protein
MSLQNPSYMPHLKKADVHSIALAWFEFSTPVFMMH